MARMGIVWIALAASCLWLGFSGHGYINFLSAVFFALTAIVEWKGDYNGN